MKSFAGTEELQAAFRLIGQALLRAETMYFWFGHPGRTCKNSTDLATVNDYFRREMVGVRTGDLELYLEDLSKTLDDSAEGHEGSPEGLPEGLNDGLAITSATGDSAPLRLLRLFSSEQRRRAMFAEVLEKEIRRRSGESDEGQTPVPTGLPVRVSS